MSENINWFYETYLNKESCSSVHSKTKRTICALSAFVIQSKFIYAFLQNPPMNDVQRDKLGPWMALDGTMRWNIKG